MAELKLEKPIAIKLFKHVPEWFQGVLEQTFGKETFSVNVCDRIKTSENDFKIEDSKVKDFINRGTPKCLYLQIEFDVLKRVVFTSSQWLINDILQIPKDEFPFSTTIIQDNERYLFT